MLNHSRTALDLLDESDLVHRQLQERSLPQENLQLTQLFTKLQSRAVIELRKTQRLQKVLLHRQKKAIAQQKRVSLSETKVEDYPQHRKSGVKNQIDEK